MDSNQRKIIFVLLIFFVLSLAVFFRLWQIESLPGGLFPDEAANGQDAVLILQGTHTPFFERGLGRESLYFYLLAGSIGLFGIGVWQIHIVSALIGILSVVAAWLLAKSLFGRKAALITAFFMATSTWHTTLSRTGFRAILIPLLATLFFYFAYLVIKEEKHKKRVLWAILSGASLGLGFYTYISFRAMLAILGLIAVIIFVIQRDAFKKFWRELIIASLSSFIVAAPLALYFLGHPGSFTGRAGCVSIFNPDLNQGDFWGTFLGVIEKTFLMFFTQGDLNWRHNVSGMSMLNPVAACFFALFILICLGFLIKERLNFFKKYFKYCVLIIWFLGMLGPAMLSAQAIPHGLRAIGAMPAVFLFSALGLMFFWEKIGRIFKDKFVLVLALAMLLLTGAVYDFNLYFNVDANSSEFYYAYRSDLTVVSDYLNERNLKKKTYLVLDEYSVQTPEYLTLGNNQPYILVDPATSYKRKMSSGDQIVFTQSTMFDTKKYKEENQDIKIVKQEFNKFGQEIMRVYEPFQN